MQEKQVSDFVTVKIDEDDDVHIINNFLENKLMVLPKDEAVAVAKFILEILDEKS